MLSMIAAVSDNGVIGRDNKLPWHLPEDLRYFKRMTLGKPVIMGRGTWESIGCRPLPGRTNVVITRQADYEAEGAQVAATLEAGVEIARNVAFIEGIEEVMIVGGAEIYRLGLALADRLYLTEVHADVEGNVFFPAWARDEWREVSRDPGSGVDGAPDYSFVVYDRRASVT